MSQNAAKGDLTLTIEENELEATIRFVPDPNGAEWTSEKLLRIFMDARIGGWSPKRAEELIQKLSRSRSAALEVVAKGEAPQPPVPEIPEWTDLPVPSELADAAAALLAESPPPILFRVKAETVRVEKTVKKPGALPFLPPRLEKVTVAERREKRERVYPDETVLSFGYARRGERVGILSIAKPGKQGKSIFGQPLPSPVDGGPFCLGAGILRQKNELLAEADGIVRRGERWIDLIPLSEHSWSVECSPDGVSYLLSYTPGDRRLAAPSAAEVLAKAGELGASEDGLLDSDELSRLLSAAAASGKALFARSISKDRDAAVRVDVSPDGLAARLSIWKGRGSGKPLELAAVSAALKASGVRGFKVEKLKNDIVDFYRSRRAELEDYLLCEGRAPGRGKGRSLNFSAVFFPEDKAVELKAGLEAQGNLAQALPGLEEFPIAAATRVALVQSGQRIGELSAAQAGQEGLDVFGRAMPALPGNDPDIRIYGNLDFSKGALTATANGLFLAAEQGGVWRLRVLRYRDAAVEVAVEPDAMSAVASLAAGEGFGAPLTVEAVISALNAKGVVQGIEPFAIAEAIADARSGKPVLRRTVARGKLPVPAGGFSVLWQLVRASGAQYALGADGRADFKERDTMTRVAAGQKLATIRRSGGGGEDGIDVLGRPVKAAATAGETAPEHDATVREESGEEGEAVLVAAVGGELLVEGGKLSIRERLALAGNLGAETGNVKFPGSVEVRGSVLAGYSLFAGGDISIGGTIEAALVSSDASVRVGEGVKGARRGTVRARKSIEASFAEHALLLAVEDIRVRNACILCNVKTNGRLIFVSDRGALIGGLCRARKGIDVSVLGSEGFAKTEISFGQDYLVADQIDAEEREIDRLKSLILQTDRSMSELERAGAGLDRVRQDKVKLVKLLEKRTLRVFDLRERFEEHHPAEVRVRGTVFPGVILESHNRFYEVRSRKTKVVFAFDPKLGRIIERPL
ncbi:MAG TPA: FapA family protein [Rectinemataceae bacterium]|nr:FapA family protein [Rectinemataceae bacterium]